LFYNGEKEWQPKTVRQLFQGFPHFEKLKSHLPDFEFLFEDAHRLPPGELLKLELSYFRTALMSMALKHRVDLIFQYFEVIFEGTSDKDERLATITYILGVAERHADEVMEALDQKEFGTKSKVMSTLEQLLEKGRKEGRQQGQEVGKQKARVFNLLKTSTRFPQMSAVDLADITELEAEKVIGLFDQLSAPGQPELLGYIQAQFLPEIKLSTEESTKLNQLVVDLLDSRR
jgi:flagellar biosynthesis/type III secretory pathway protein FliH